MEFNKKLYVARGIPRIDKSFIESQGRNPQKEDDLTPFRLENPYLGAVLDYRSSKVQENMQKKARGMNFTDVVLQAEREFRIRASLLYQGLFFGSEQGAGLSQDSGLPVLTEKMGEDWEKVYHNIRRLSKNSNEFLEFLKDKDILLFDLMSCFSSEYPSSRPPIDGREFDMNHLDTMVDFVNNRGNIGAEKIYRFLKQKNQAIILEDQFRK